MPDLQIPANPRGAADLGPDRAVLKSGASARRRPASPMATRAGSPPCSFSGAALPNKRLARSPRYPPPRRRHVSDPLVRADVVVDAHAFQRRRTLVLQAAQKTSYRHTEAIRLVVDVPAGVHMAARLPFVFPEPQLFAPRLVAQRHAEAIFLPHLGRRPERREVNPSGAIGRNVPNVCMRRLRAKICVL